MVLKTSLITFFQYILLVPTYRNLLFYMIRIGYLEDFRIISSTTVCRKFTLYRKSITTYVYIELVWSSTWNIFNYVIIIFIIPFDLRLLGTEICELYFAREVLSEIINVLYWEHLLSRESVTKIGIIH